MPLLMRCSEIQPGTTLWEPLMYEGRVLLTTGRPLSAAEASTMHRRCPDTIVQVAEERLDRAADFENDIEDRCVAQKVCHRLRLLLVDVFDRFEASEHPRLSENDIGKVRDVIAEIKQYLKFHHVSSLLLPPCTSPATFLTDHLANVVYASLVFGTSIRSYVTAERQRLCKATLLPKHLADLSPLALGAAFLDIGMMPLRDLYAHRGPLTAAQRDAVRDHCGKGVEMMPVNFSSLARMMIRSHHENANGTGYPEGVESGRLHVFLRIAHIADVFNARTSRGVFSHAGSIASVSWGMRRDTERFGYDPFLVPIFLDLIRPFRIGAQVRLTDGREAVVVRHERGRPFHPVVLIAFDQMNRPIDPPLGPFSLATEPALQIQSYGGEDLGYIYGRRNSPPPPILEGDSLLATLYGLPDPVYAAKADRW